MDGRGVAGQVLLNHVPVEPGDGGQSPGDGGAGPFSVLEFAREQLDAGSADGEQAELAVRHQAVHWRRSRAQAWRVRPEYPAMNPTHTGFSGSENTGSARASAADEVVAIGTSRLEPGHADQ